MVIVERAKVVWSSNYSKMVIVVKRNDKSCGLVSQNGYSLDERGGEFSKKGYI